MNIVSRSEWGARHGNGYAVGTQDEVIIHHAYRPDVGVVSLDKEKSTTRSIESYHAKTFWPDGDPRARIAYSFLVYDSGRIHEGVGWNRYGAHTAGHNHKAAVCFVIDGDARLPSAAAWNATQALLTDGVDRGKLTPGFTISGHRDHANKSCPGNKVYPRIQQLKEDDMPTPEEIAEAVWATKPGGDGYKGWRRDSYLQHLHRTAAATLDAVRAVAKKVDEMSGGGADAERIVDEIAERLGREEPS